MGKNLFTPINIDVDAILRDDETRNTFLDEWSPMARNEALEEAAVECDRRRLLPAAKAIRALKVE